jgi:hypothetical protein
MTAEELEGDNRERAKADTGFEAQQQRRIAEAEDRERREWARGTGPVLHSGLEQVQPWLGACPAETVNPRGAAIRRGRSVRLRPARRRGQVIPGTIFANPVLRLFAVFRSMLLDLATRSQ